MRTILLLVSVLACSLQSAEAMDPKGFPQNGNPVLRISQTVDPCHKRCAPLLQQDSRSESKRTYLNCRALCAGKGTVLCPDGSRIKIRPGVPPKC